jgi:hypothetical protein
MPAPRTSAIARHVEAAKSLLLELERQAATAMDALGRDQNAEFFAVVDDRTRLLERLEDIVEAIVQERALAAAEHAGQPDAATAALLSEMAQAAAAALESHEQLTTETRRERNRLAQVHARAGRPDAVAHQYAATSSHVARSRTFSVSG